MLNLQKPWSDHLTASAQPWPIVFSSMLFPAWSFKQTDHLQCHGWSLAITCYAMASVHEPCEGSRHFIENGCTFFWNIFMSLESIWRAFRRVKYRQTSKNISQCFKRRHLIIYLLSNHKIRRWRGGGGNLGYWLNWWTKISPKVKFYTNYLNWSIFNGG